MVAVTEEFVRLGVSLLEGGFGVSMRPSKVVLTRDPEGIRVMAMEGLCVGICNACLAKQLEIDRLQEQVVCLKAQLRYRTKQQQEGFFGSSTPSAKKPVKANTPKPSSGKKRGAQQGHPGHGRPSYEQDETVRVEEIAVNVDQCPCCGGYELEECEGENLSVL